MGSDVIHKLTMPKWGLSMTHGRVVEWLVPEGGSVDAGTSVAEVETEKITGCVESSTDGTLRRQIAKPGQDVPIGGLLAVIADPSVSDDAIDRFVEGFLLEDESDESALEDAAPEFVEAGGRRLRYLKLGEGGEPAILIHGFTGSLDSWLFNHSVLANNRAVYALDLPGHGQSSKDVGDGSLDTLIGATVEWLDALELPRVHLVGHSLGGAIALGISLRHPERVHSLSLLASAALGPEINTDYISGVVEASRRKALKSHLMQLVADPNLVTRQMVDDLLKYKRLDGVQAALAKLAEGLVKDGNQTTQLRHGLEQLPQPAQVIWGQADRIIPASHSRDLPTRVSVTMLENCGHLAQMEAASVVNERLLNFLGRPTD